MFSVKKWILEAHRLTHQLVRAQFFPLFVLFGVSTAMNIGFEDAMQGMGAAEETQRWLLQLTLGIWDLIEGVILFLILSYGIPKVRALKPPHLVTQPFGTPYLGFFLAEYLRMFAQILLWGLLLVLPGFIRYFQLIFVPYVALFSRSYRDDEVDAVRLSRQLFAEWKWTIVIAVFAVWAVGAFVEFLPQQIPDLHILPVRIVCAVLSSLISVFGYSLLYLLFEHALGLNESRGN